MFEFCARFFNKPFIFLLEKGDSGGPYSVKVGSKWMLGGLTSWGYGCGDGGVYTRVSLYLSWIQFVTKNYTQ